VYYVKRRSDHAGGVTDIMRVPVEGGDEEVVVESSRSGFGQWGLSTRGLHFVDQEPSPTGTRWVVKALGFEQGLPREVGELEGPIEFFGPSFDVSSDGRWILSTHQREESDLMLAENFR
jgi:hypothetical protein